MMMDVVRLGIPFQFDEFEGLLTNEKTKGKVRMYFQ